MYRYDMLATPQGTLRPDLALARKQRCEMNAAELNRAAAVPDPYLLSALQDDIRKHKLDLELMEYELASMEQCATKGTADVFQSKLAHMLCVGRRVQTGPRPTPSQDPCYEGAEVPQGSDFLLWPCDPLDGPASIRNLNPEFQQFPGYRGLWNISHPDRSTELSAKPLQEVPGSVDSGQGSDHSEHSDSEHEPRSDADSASSGGAEPGHVS